MGLILVHWEDLIMKISFLAFLLIGVLALTACGGGNGTAESTPHPVQTPTYTPSQPTTPNPSQQTNPEPQATEEQASEAHYTESTPTPEAALELTLEPLPFVGTITMEAMTVAAGGTHTLAIMQDGALWACAY